MNSFKHAQNSFLWFFDPIEKIGINYFLNIDDCEGIANDYWLAEFDLAISLYECRPVAVTNKIIAPHRIGKKPC
jgi:hypothetical protein